MCLLWYVTGRLHIKAKLYWKLCTAEGDILLKESIHDHSEPHIQIAASFTLD